MSKILIADDDAFLIKIYSTHLQQDGHEVITCTDGQSALEQAISQEPDVILLDIMLPRMNGLDVLEEIRSSRQTKSTPVICLSNLNQDEDQKAALDLGANEFLIKAKLTPSQIIEVVHKYLKAPKSSKSSDT